MKHLFVLTCLLFFACNNKKNNNNNNRTANQPTGFGTKNVAGVFYDTLPCADCPGMAAKLYLKPDNSFIMELAYIGKNVVYDLGKWSLTDSILKLTGTEGISQFKILNHATIKLLDNEGRMIYDTTNRRLTLQRNNTPFQPLQPVPVEGIFSADGNTMNILICAMGNNYPVALAPSAMSMKAAYNKAIHKKSEPLYAKLKGHFELRPSLNDTTTKDFFVVEHFMAFVPGQQCK
ncbi:hypothetical protein FC093_14830 [Ilyomonas limi]|uniref:NlpE C-terminal OB domain-containing protein n=1 Tax=Ilyomonas limi TaxID=2575867 RepID=A0A4U3KX76_9BACT|nr:copper resistance protein NlpE N-terminal domain-containing protein [Ilyomonas limi]TKK67158.1 hypothetical protein FC093_14830 [Ilyomonas limi]